MVKKTKYVIIKKHNYQEVLKIKLNNIYDMSSKTPIKGGISVKRINLIDQAFIDKMINKRINKRFKSLLELIASICESDEDPSSGLMFALTETEKFKREMLNKYARLLNKQEKENMLNAWKVQKEHYQWHIRYQEKALWEKNRLLKAIWLIAHNVEKVNQN